MEPYSFLTERGQALRLRQLALNALTHYQLDVSRVRLITNEMNGIFRVDTTDGRKFVLRVSLPEGGHTLDHVTAELDWLETLAKDTALNVPRPIPANNGDLVVEASAEGVPESRLCAIFSWVPGKDLADDLSPENMVKLGELMARLHQHTLTFIPSNALSLLKFDKVFPFPEPVIMFEKDNAALFTKERREIYEKGIAWAQESIDRLKASGETMRILHGDLHQWNVRVSRGVLSPIDFEDLMLGWPVQDIATTLYYFLNESYSVFREAFRTGYSWIAQWPERYPGEIDSFIAARGLGMANFVLNDPSLIGNTQPIEFIQRIEKRLIVLLKENQR